MNNMLSHAREAADELLARLVADGSVTPGIAESLAAEGFTTVTVSLAGMRASGMSEQDITDLIEDQLRAAHRSGDAQRIVADELMLAVWGGMKRDFAAYLHSTATEH